MNCMLSIVVCLLVTAWMVVCEADPGEIPAKHGTNDNPVATDRSTVQSTPTDGQAPTSIRILPGAPGSPFPAGQMATLPTGRPMLPPTGPPIPKDLLAWDAATKDLTVKSGTATASFAFQVTNVSKEPIVFTSIRTSCACTVANLPRSPWTLEPGGKGTIDVTMNLAGKRGVVAKRVLVISDHGFETLNVRTDIQEAPAGAIGEGERLRNLQIATANRQAVLKGDCASCHSTPAIGKTGAELYNAACTICHEGERRASSVPDLKHLNKTTNAEYWRTWITSSAEGKLMPAFGVDHGGVLTAAQIDSLVKYLVETIPSTIGPEPPGRSLPNISH